MLPFIYSKIFPLALSVALLCSCTSRADENAVLSTNTADASVIAPTITPSVTENPTLEAEVITATPTPTPEPTPTPTPSPTYPDVPEQEPVEDDFFCDAAFLGNSLVDGFRMFSGITTPDYFAVTSLTVTNASTQVDLMNQSDYGKIYILLGINEIGYDVEYFIEQYSAMLDNIKINQPDADIYVMSITPVSAAKSGSSSTFTQARVEDYNTALYDLAAEKECYYLDIFTPLGDEEGFLPSNRTSDGVHFTVDHYAVWADYLRTHYVIDVS